MGSEEYARSCRSAVTEPEVGPSSTSTVAGPGRDLTLRYRTIEFEPSTNLLVRAQSTLFTSIDRVTVAESETGTTVTYDAELRLNGIGGLFDPVLRLVFGRIGDRATAGLRRVLA